MKLAAIVCALFASVLLSLAAGCGGGRARPAVVPTTASAAEVDAVAAIDPAAADAAVAQLLGGWVGAGASPFGEMPFAALFERLPDGSARAWADDGNGTAIDLHLRRAADGWRLREEASLPKVGTQAHTLRLSAAEVTGPRARLLFTHPERPGFLDIELLVDAEQLVLEARLRGEPHVRFTMKRLPEAALAKLAARLHAPGTAAPAGTAATVSTAAP